MPKCNTQPRYNHERFTNWREVLDAFQHEWIEPHNADGYPIILLDQAMLEWLYTKVGEEIEFTKQKKNAEENQ